MGFFKFDQLITPKILAVVYLLLVIFCVVMALKTGSTMECKCSVGYLLLSS
jgi:hypothetical protein